MVMAKSGHLSTHQSQRLHSIGFTATGKPSSSVANTLGEHSSIQILHRLHHLSNIWMVTLGYLLFFFLSVYLTFVFLDNTKTIPHFSGVEANTNPYCPEWSRWNWWKIFFKQDTDSCRYPQKISRFIYDERSLSYIQKALQLFNQRASSFKLAPRVQPSS